MQTVLQLLEGIIITATCLCSNVSSKCKEGSERSVLWLKAHTVQYHMLPSEGTVGAHNQSGSISQLGRSEGSNTKERW